jgi:hypothetical protein
MKITLHFIAHGRTFEHTIPAEHTDRALFHWRKYADTLLALVKRKIGCFATFSKVVKNDGAYKNAFSNKELYNVPKILNTL